MARGELDEEIEKRIQAGWRNWRRMSGVLCDKRLSARRKGKVFKVVVRPVMTFRAETWNIKKSQEKKMDVAEIKMLRWACGHNLIDKVRTEQSERKLRSRKCIERFRREDYSGTVMY